MVQDKIIRLLQALTHHNYIHLVQRGNTAIEAALSYTPKFKKVLIPAEGGWIHYQKAPGILGLESEEVLCNEAKINPADLQQKLATGKFGAFLYQNPGGYFAEEPMAEIFELGKKYHCLIIVDVSGSIGTKLCQGSYADILVGSFGEWKLVEAKVGGFISTNNKLIADYLAHSEYGQLQDKNSLLTIYQKMEQLPERIKFLQQIRSKVIKEIGTMGLKVVHPADLGFVVVVKYNTGIARERIIDYCQKNDFAYTECPRYIRLNEKAISIEIKREE